jgi:hypothetical protein
MKEDRPAARNTRDPKDAQDDAKKVRPTDPPFDADVEHPVGTGVGAGGGWRGCRRGARLHRRPDRHGHRRRGCHDRGRWAGREIARHIDMDAEHDYWRTHYAERPYVRAGAAFDDYAPAYRYGIDAYEQHGDRMFEHVESDLASGWNDARGNSRLEWSDARDASRDAWERCARHDGPRDAGQGRLVAGSSLSRSRAGEGAAVALRRPTAGTSRRPR